MSKYDIEALNHYLYGCQNVTPPGEKTIDGDTLIAAYIDLRHSDFDVVIAKVRVDEPSEEGEKKGDIRFVYRTIQTSEGVNGYCPDHLAKEGLAIGLNWSAITGNRIRFTRLFVTSDATTKVRYAVRQICEIFFQGGLRNIIQYRYEPEGSSLSMSDHVQDGQFSINGLYVDGSRDNRWHSNYRSDLYYPKLTSDDIHAEITNHERGCRYWY